MGPRYSGMVGPWDSGTVTTGQWDGWTMGPRDSGTVGQWDHETMGRLVSRSRTLYLKKQSGKGLVKLPWQIASDHTTIFEALNWIFEVCANYYGE